MEEHTNSTIDNKTNKLITLLDCLLFLNGNTLTTQIDRPPMTLPPFPTDSTPIAVQMCTHPSLSDRLEEHDQDLHEEHDLAARIYALSRIPAVMKSAHAQLDAEHRALNTSTKEQKEACASEHLPQKLRRLRKRQQRAARPPREPTFSVIVLAGIDFASGQPEPLITRYNPISAGWEDFTEDLTQATRYGRPVDDDVTGGCTLEHGKWLYQYFGRGEAEKALQELANEADYVAMRRELHRRRGFVLVWHERIFAASKTARREAKDRRRFETDLSDVDLEEFGIEMTLSPGSDGC